MVLGDSASCRRHPGAQAVAKSRKDKLPSELARFVRGAIISGRYEAANQVGKDVLAKKPHYGLALLSIYQFYRRCFE